MRKAVSLSLIKLIITIIIIFINKNPSFFFNSTGNKAETLLSDQSNGMIHVR